MFCFTKMEKIEKKRKNIQPLQLYSQYESIHDNKEIEIYKKFLNKHKCALKFNI